MLGSVLHNVGRQVFSLDVADLVLPKASKDYDGAKMGHKVMMWHLDAHGEFGKTSSFADDPTYHLGNLCEASYQNYKSSCRPSCPTIGAPNLDGVKTNAFERTLTTEQWNLRSKRNPPCFPREMLQGMAIHHGGTRINLWLCMSLDHVKPNRSR